MTTIEPKTTKPAPLVPLTPEAIRKWITARAEGLAGGTTEAIGTKEMEWALYAAESEFLGAQSIRYASNLELERLVHALAGFDLPTSHEAIISEACERVNKSVKA
jgi:hypothetical protein